MMTELDIKAMEYEKSAERWAREYLLLTNPAVAYAYGCNVGFKAGYETAKKEEQTSKVPVNHDTQSEVKDG